jgi:hypothetical protein
MLGTLVSWFEKFLEAGRPDLIQEHFSQEIAGKRCLTASPQGVLLCQFRQSLVKKFLLLRQLLLPFQAEL